MRYALTLGLLLMLCVSQARATDYPPPVPKPTTPIPVSAKADWIYDGLTAREERSRLRRFAARLEDEPWAQGYIVSYGGLRAYDGEAPRRAERVRRYLIREYGVMAGRLVVVEGGRRGSWTVEFFVVPVGATPPAPTPTVGANAVPKYGAGPGRRRRRRDLPPAPNNGMHPTAKSAALIRETPCLFH